MCSSTTQQLSSIDRFFGFRTPVIWRNVVIFTVFHILAAYALVTVVPRARIITIFFSWCVLITGGIGVTVGVHRLWTHRSFKAPAPVRFLLMLCYMFAGQYSIAQWVRDHRTHHRFADTDADPHNAHRGFFFAHCGWFLMKRHPELKIRGKEVDISDVLADPVVQFHQRYYTPLLLVLHGVLPQAVAYYYLGEDLQTCILGVLVLRYCATLHPIWCVNSVSHFYGYKPYNKNIKAVQNIFTAFFALGEGWHNFHHVFPWDYRIGELGQGWQVGCYVIDALAALGLATDLRTVSPDLVARVMNRNQSHDLSEVSEVSDWDAQQIQRLVKSSS